MEFLRRLKQKWPETEVLVITAYGSIDTAVEAMRCGAYDYLTKPIDRERFPLAVEKALERHALAVENKQLKDRLETRTRFDHMVGESEPMQRVYSLVDMVAIATSRSYSREKAEPERNSLPVRSITKATGPTVRSSR